MYDKIKTHLEKRKFLSLDLREYSKVPEKKSAGKKTRTKDPQKKSSFGKNIVLKKGPRKKFLIFNFFFYLAECANLLKFDVKIFRNILYFISLCV